MLMIITNRYRNRISTLVCLALLVILTLVVFAVIQGLFHQSSSNRFVDSFQSQVESNIDSRFELGKKVDLLDGKLLDITAALSDGAKANFYFSLATLLLALGCFLICVVFALGHAKSKDIFPFAKSERKKDEKADAQDSNAAETEEYDYTPAYKEHPKDSNRKRNRRTSL